VRQGGAGRLDKPGGACTIKVFRTAENGGESNGLHGSGSGYVQAEAAFQIFFGLAFPYVGTTAPVDITALMEKIRREGLPFFLTFCYCAARAANRVPEFRRRILNGGIVEYARCRTSHTVALEDETYCYCTLESAMPFAEYLPYAKREQERAKAARSRKARRPGRHRAAFFLRFIYILALFFCGALHYNIKYRL
jgi:chloramphenicol O-acetyltransferase